MNRDIVNRFNPVRIRLTPRPGRGREAIRGGWTRGELSRADPLASAGSGPSHRRGPSASFALPAKSPPTRCVGLKDPFFFHRHNWKANRCVPGKLCETGEAPLPLPFDTYKGDEGSSRPFTTSDA